MNHNKKTISSFFVAMIVLICFNGCWESKPQQENKIIPKTSLMKITSSAFENGEAIPSKYSCDGSDISPPLSISDIPEETKSIALIYDDPDAPAGTWVHWLLWNIDPSTTEIKENSVPAGATEGTTSSGSTGYGGPCPPSGTHRYFFKIYALDTELDIGPDSDKAALESAMKDHILDQAELMGKYSKS